MKHPNRSSAYEQVLRNSRVRERMFRLWISRFNEQGIEGLTYRPGRSRTRKLAAEKIATEILPRIDVASQFAEPHKQRNRAGKT